MVIKAETCGFIILRPVCQYIYSFQYFFDKPIAFQLLKITVNFANCFTNE